MQLWVVLIGSGFVMAGLFVVCSLRLELNFRALGEPSGHWSVVFACGGGPLALSAVALSGVPTRWTLHLAKRRYALPRPGQILTKLRRGQSKPKPTRTASSRPFEWGRVWDWLEFGFAHRRRLRVVSLDADLIYGFSDIALTGRIAGALYALSGALPAQIRLTQRATWGGEERWELSCAGLVRVFPVLVLLDVLWYIIRRRPT